MTRNILGLGCGILALTAVVSAQTPQSPTASSNPVTTRQSSVVTGCVATDTASEPGATSGTSRRFILSNAQWLTDGESMQGRQTAATSFLLTNSDLNLGDHVGHKVQLTGYVDSSGASSASSTQGSTSSPSMRVFHATSVVMLSETCP